MTDDWEIGSFHVQQFVRLFGGWGEEGDGGKKRRLDITVTGYWPATDGSMFPSPIYHFFFLPFPPLSCSLKREIQATQ